MVMEQETSADPILSLIYPLGIVCLLAPAFAGVSIGMAKASHGICQAAAVKNDIILTIVPSAFIGVSILYAALIFFLGRVSGPAADFHKPLTWLAGQIIAGAGLFWGSIGLGDITAVAAITAAQQKRFKMAFFLLLIFGEFSGLFSLIIGVILTSENKW
ncbi:V-type H+-transporting ATPase 16kDa proteolipid subunit [Nematocida minor]|uniref:V-type H+-transporting ATPase 16kDa proteolipid subunit n=1 Tax=Nematocida minor TaxID=1912983 RepID=UPI00221F52DB|nr:V-type H+-transporting ATPase 16kDa proteolipid subunit [Nematocida minor]KAI5190536.1 V-type H+-transporting ATPase 16kDa proteolipid subunit [Nematocida minor]